MPGYNNTIKVADADQKSRCCGVEAIKGFKPEGTDLFGNKQILVFANWQWRPEICILIRT